MLHGGLTVGSKMCRFCVKQRGTSYCCLYDKALNVHGDGTVDKCKECLGDTKGWFKKPVQVINAAIESTKINPQAIVKSAADQMLKVTKQLISEGYPLELAMKLAHDLVAKGGW